MALFRENVGFLGKIGIVEEDGFITRIHFEKEAEEQDVKLGKRKTPLIKEAFSQLQLYFHGELKEFSLPLMPQGTEFMKNVWQKLCEVPYGKTASYKDIAIAAGNPKATRAVGMANNKNPIPIIIPCHRIIGSNGKLVGYGGGLDIKKKLLALEGLIIKE